MKLAILGNSPLALEAALRFHFHGAALTWYMSPEGFSAFDSGEHPPLCFSSKLGLQVLNDLNQNYSPDLFNWSQWVKGYEQPLVQFLKTHQEVREDEVVCVSKRFLTPLEEISGRSRFYDLFRLIYKVNPKEFIEDQKESSPETYKKLTEEFVQSLATSIEMYHDYDLILDCRTDLSRTWASVSGRALGEGRISRNVSYSVEALQLGKNLEPTTDLRDLCVVGSDSLAVEIVLSLAKWLKDKHSNLFIISSEEDPFSSFLEEGNPKTTSELKNLLKYMEDEFQEEVKSFSQKLREWQTLDDFVQVKIPRPAEPIPRLNFFSGHNVMAIDELIDRKRMFITLEKPDFRQGKKHPENNHLDLKTLGVDHILVANAKKNRSIIELPYQEIGFFDLIPIRANIKNSWEKDLEKLKGVEDEVFKLFSPVNPH
jgi:hypothetical protein